MVHYALEILQNMRVKSGKNFGDISNIWPCGDCQVHERANNRDIGHLAHFRCFSIILRRHGGGKAQSRVQWSGCRLAVLHIIVLKEIGNLLTLEEKKVMMRTISMYFKTQELSGWPPIVKLEVLRQILYYGVEHGSI